MMDDRTQGETRRRSGRGAGLAGLVAAGLLAGCASEPDVLGPPVGGTFSPQAVAASIFSLRFAPDNVAVASVRTISAALGLTSASVVTARAGEFAPGASGGSVSLVPARPGNALPRLDAVPASPERGRDSRVALAPAFSPEPLRAAVARNAAQRGAGNAVPLFPLNFLGGTFVFDAATDAYVLDRTLGGAPPDGVRFVLYTLDPASGLPSLPLFPIGFVDLVDESNATSTRLRVRAFDTSGGGNAPLADYFVDGAFGSVSTGIVVNLIAAGFITDRNGRFDFSFDEVLETDDAADLTLVSLIHDVVTAEATDMHLEVEGEIDNAATYSDLTYQLDIRGTGGRTRVDLRVVDDRQDGEIRHNGQLEVLVGGTVQQPTFDPAAGGAFTLSEFEALDEILFGIDDILILADDLYTPLADLFGVS